jgi:hypothetical protein
MEKVEREEKEMTHDQKIKTDRSDKEIERDLCEAYARQRNTLFKEADARKRNTLFKRERKQRNARRITEKRRTLKQLTALLNK